MALAAAEMLGGDMPVPESTRIFDNECRQTAKEIVAAIKPSALEAATEVEGKTGSSQTVPSVSKTVPSMSNNAAERQGRLACRPKPRKPAAPETDESRSQSGSDSDSDTKHPPVVTSRTCTVNKPSDHLLDSVTQQMANLKTGSKKTQKSVAVGDRQVITAEGVIVRPTALQSRWSGVIRDALLEGEWQAVSALICSVRTVNLGNGQMGGEWHPFDWKLMRKLRSTVCEYGLHSEPSKHFINYLFDFNVMTPNDCKLVAKFLLTPVQYLLWEHEWERQAQWTVETPRAVGDPLYAVTLEMLLGRGAYASPTQQLTFPVQIHNAAAEAAKQALFLVPSERRPPSYTSIKQGMQEPFESFVSRLMQSLDQAEDLPEELRRHMLRAFAFENANGKTKRILSTLPITATIEEMVELLANSTLQQQTAFVTEAIKSAISAQTQVLASALRLLAREGWPRSNSNKGACYRCGQTGHLRRTCSTSVWCDQCQSGTHSTLACRRSGKGGRGRRAAARRQRWPPKLFIPTTRDKRESGDRPGNHCRRHPN